ncbi:hypothetical protein CASFOL_011112 [Castilleja foliolosa]|uniref:Uncharacterized protein n=1 Tax=Castilleja foliolosa TaxID=1961234 RepID=A0ABD3DWJ7_9LAMI
MGVETKAEEQGDRFSVHAMAATGPPLIMQIGVRLLKGEVLGSTSLSWWAVVALVLGVAATFDLVEVSGIGGAIHQRRQRLTQCGVCTAAALTCVDGEFQLVSRAKAVVRSGKHSFYIPSTTMIEGKNGLLLG